MVINRVRVLGSGSHTPPNFFWEYPAGCVNDNGNDIPLIRMTLTNLITVMTTTKTMMMTMVMEVMAAGMTGMEGAEGAIY